MKAKVHAHPSSGANACPRGKLTGGTVMLPKPLPEGIEPEDCYATRLTGDCLKPLVYDDCGIVAAGNLHPRNGDFAVIYFHGREQPLLKLIVMVPPVELMNIKSGGNVVPIVIAEQLNPRRQYHFPVDKIEAIHRVIGFTPAGSDIAIPVDKFISDALAA